MEPLIRNISDTARWVASYRAQESERPDAIFRDPFARALAGERGAQIAAATPFLQQAAWSMIARTYLIDQIVESEVQRGADLVVNLAAGLDTRPHRMDLPPALRWVEVDLPEILDYKERILADAAHRCALERIRLDLSDRGARRALFDRLGGSARRVLIIAEGLVIYLPAEDVGALARDLAAVPTFARWAVDIASPGLLKMMQKRMGDMVARAGAPYRFAPPEGPPFFIPFGWTPIDVRSLLKTAAKLKRLSLFLRLVSLLPDSSGAQGSRPWSAVCLLANSAAG
ncbi:MAG TPA: SAM-dependent methyltransferase [Vicinamibacterales bacterium]|jgi:methyltransferase (TIGR00027 family)|nr:SAM-dependent methyltransferase [Vicinamibacterales bacterium]